MNGIEDRVTSLLTWGLPLGALAQDAANAAR